MGWHCGYFVIMFLKIGLSSSNSWSASGGLALVFLKCTGNEGAESYDAPAPSITINTPYILPPPSSSFLNRYSNLPLQRVLSARLRTPHRISLRWYLRLSLNRNSLAL